MEPTIRDIPLVRCPSCARFRIRGRWRESEASRALTAYLRDAIIEDIEIVEAHASMPKRLPKRLHIEGILRADAEYAFAIDIPTVREQCPTCAKQASGYFEGYLQLRGASEEQIAHAREILERHGGRIVAMRTRKDGVDYTVSSNTAIRKTLKELAESYVGSETLSASLHTRDSQTSKEKHRLTGLFRFFGLRKGDPVLYDEQGWVIRAIQKRRVTLRRLGAREERTVAVSESFEALPTYTTEVIACYPSIRILSEEYEPVDAERMGRMPRIGDQVRVVIFDGSYFILGILRA